MPHDNESSAGTPSNCSAWITPEADETPILLRPVGRVHSPVRSAAEMPRAGVPAAIEIFPAFEAALDSIASNSHLVIIGWFDRADRTRLLASPRPRGVFGIRSAVRPNPLGLTVARLLRVEGRRLEVDALDFLDGTPIVDVKRYAPGWDCVFSATTSHELRFRHEETEAAALDDMMGEAAKFHGERCAGAALAVRALRWALVRWRLGPRDPALSVRVGLDGHIADALQGLTGARFGNGRLAVGAGERFAIAAAGERIWFRPRADPAAGCADLLSAPLDALLEVEIEHR